MPQRIEVPGMGVVEFPDGMTDDQITSAIRANMPKSEPSVRMHQTQPPAESIDGIPRMFPRQRATPKADSTREFGEVLSGVGAAFVGGPLVAAGLRSVPLVAKAAPGLIKAAESAGMTTGADLVGATIGKRAADLGIRTAGGALAGGASAAMVNPEDARSGAVIGAALPGVVQFLGKFGSVVGGVFKPRDARAGAELAKALDLLTPADRAAVIAQLRAAPELVPGARPTVAQALQTPQAGILERVVGDSAGGAALQNQRAAQNAARLAALDSVAPTVPNGFRSAQQDMGEAIARYAVPARAGKRAQTSALFNEVPQDEAMLYLPDLAPVRDKFFGPGVFTDRGAVDRAVSTANQIGTVTVPGIVPTRATQAQPKTLAQAVRSAGGLNLARNDGRAGELIALKGDLKNLVRNDGGMTPARMAQKMHEAGYIADDSADTLIEALRTDSRTAPQFSAYDLPERAWAAARDAGNGAAPEATKTAIKVTLRDFEGLRSSIGQEQRAAAKAGDSKAAAALAEMKKALDSRIDEVVRGDGAIDENLPIDWADKLTAARKSKVEEVQRFGTGPQAAIFRQGADGQPLVQGGEVAAKFWGTRPGLADDVKSFRRLIEDNPALLGQFRSMVTTQGAGTTTAAGNLSSKFAQWFDTVRPGLDRLFEPEKVRAMERIAQDIRRADAAANAGRGIGSNTYQNAQNALSIGLLDNPLVAAGAGRIPFVGAGVDLLRESATKGKAKRLAEILADSESAANALQLAYPAASNRVNPLLLGGYRAAPLLGTGR